MENRLKTRISKIFQSSLRSCGSRRLLDVAEDAFLIPESSKQDRPLPSLCKPLNHIVSSSIIPKKASFPFIDGDDVAYTPAPPRGNSYKKSKKRRNRKATKPTTLSRSFSKDSVYYYDWFSSDEDEKDKQNGTVLVSDSFVAAKSVQRSPASIFSDCSRKKGNGTTTMKCSVAVVKTSRDPYKDFRLSMMEMILEMQIVGEEELEGLLFCFLSLNSESHHYIIMEVFSEICDALFAV